MRRIAVCARCKKTKPQAARGWCVACWQFHRDNGYARPEHLDLAWKTWNAPLLRFMRFVKHEDRCWEWTGSNENGYGRFQSPDGVVIAHRWIWEQLIGEIPDGMQLDHLCRNTACVFPGHLEPVTPLENTARGSRGGRKECMNGHALTGDNVLISADREGHQRRRCAICTRAYQREWREKRRTLNLEST